MTRSLHLTAAACIFASAQASLVARTSAAPAVSVPVSPPTVISALLLPTGEGVAAPPDGSLSASIILPPCEAPPGTQVSVRLLDRTAASSTLGGTAIVAYGLTFDHRTSCPSLPNFYYAATLPVPAPPLLVELTDDAEAHLATIDPYRFGPAAFEGGMYPPVTPQRRSFEAGREYVATLRESATRMLALPLSLAPSTVPLPVGGGFSGTISMPGLVSGGGRLVWRSDDVPPPGIPAPGQALGTPVVYANVQTTGDAVFGGEASLTLEARPGTALDGRYALAIYDPELFTKGWTLTGISLIPSARDAAARTVRFTIPDTRAFYKRYVFALVRLSPQPDAGAATPAPAQAPLSLPSAAKPIFAVVGDSISLLTLLPPSPVGCIIGFSPPPSCQPTLDPSVSFPALVAASTGLQLLNLSWLATAAGTNVQETESQLVLQIPQIPANAAVVMYASGIPDILHDPGLDVVARVNAIDAAIRARAPHARLVYVGPRYYSASASDPVRRPEIDAWNAREAELARRHGDAYVDLRAMFASGIAPAFPDGAHPAPDTQAAIAGAVLAALNISK